MDKGEIIREILMAVNARAEQTKGTHYATQKADGSMFFKLAFMEEKDLKQICKLSGIKL